MFNFTFYVNNFVWFTSKKFYNFLLISKDESCVRTALLERTLLLENLKIASDRNLKINFVEQSIKHSIFFISQQKVLTNPYPKIECFINKF